MCSAGARRPPRGEALTDLFPRPGAATLFCWFAAHPPVNPWTAMLCAGPPVLWVWVEGGGEGRV